MSCEECRYWAMAPTLQTAYGLCLLRAVTRYYDTCEDGLPKPASEPADIDDAYQRGFTVGWCGALNIAQKMLENESKKVSGEQ